MSFKLFIISGIKQKKGSELNSKSDNDILKIIETDLNKGFDLVVEVYSVRLYWHIRRLVVLHEDADDALQNTFISAWRNFANYRKESSIYTWLFAIATNEALALIKKRARNSAVPLDDLEGLFANSVEGNSWFDGDEAMIKLQNAILALPEKQRVVFNLKYFEDMTYEDMSIVLKTSVGALKASYHHAVKKVQNILKAV